MLYLLRKSDKPFDINAVAAFPVEKRPAKSCILRDMRFEDRAGNFESGLCSNV